MNLTTPTDDEFQSWKLHPVSQYVAEAYRIGAQRQREQWAKLFSAEMIDPTKVLRERDILRTREDAYNAFLETTLDDYIAIVDPAEHAERHKPTPIRRAR